MKTSIYIFFYISILLVSCSSSTENPVSKNGNNTTTNLSFQLGCDQKYVSEDSVRTIYIILGYGFYLTGDSNDTIPVNAGRMMISDLEFDFKEEFAKVNGQTYGYLALLPDDLKHDPIYGGKSKWGISGNDDYGIDEFYKNYYVCKKIKLLKPAPGDSLALDEDLLIKWEADAHQLCNTTITIKIDNVNSDEETFWSEEIPDDGEFLVDKKEIQGLDDSDEISITILRNQRWSEKVGNFNYHFYANSSIEVRYDAIF